MYFFIWKVNYTYSYVHMDMQKKELRTSQNMMYTNVIDRSYDWCISALVLKRGNKSCNMMYGLKIPN